VVGGGEGDDHWAVVLKDSEPPATGVYLLSLQPAYLLQYHRTQWACPAM
jgi:hypothetical protein